jgi:hypothetical protein
MSRHSASDEVVTWIESLAGLLMKIDTTYGGVAEMLERPDWDAGRTAYAKQLLDGLCDRLQQVRQEFQDHVAEKLF